MFFEYGKLAAVAFCCYLLSDRMFGCKALIELIKNSLDVRLDMGGIYFCKKQFGWVERTR